LQLSAESLSILALGIALIALEPRLAKLEIPSHAELQKKSVPVWSALSICALAGVCVLRIAEQSYSPFLYFQF
jgi:alginate O-acetyltransferase complex protein AlgI